MFSRLFFCDEKYWTIDGTKRSDHDAAEQLVVEQQTTTAALTQQQNFLNSFFSSMGSSPIPRHVLKPN